MFGSTRTPSKPRSRALGSCLCAVMLLFGCADPIGFAGRGARLDERVASEDRIALPRSTRPEIDAADIMAHVEALTAPATEGRLAGTRGERVAADYLARAMRRIGLEPAGHAGRFESPFEFTSGIALGPHNRLTLELSDGSVERFEVDSDWRPLAFSRSGEVRASEVVFAGYGLVAPATEGGDAIDEYAGLDVSDRWVLVFRDLPHDLDGVQRQQLQRHTGLRYKAMIARDRGARGVLFVTGPLGDFREQLAPLRFDASLSGTRIAVLSLSDATAERLLAGTGARLETLQREANQRWLAGEGGAAHTPGDSPVGFAPHADEGSSPVLTGVRLGSRIDLEMLAAEGRNVIGRLRVGPQPSEESIVLGAHFDHLGRGEGSSSLARGDEVGAIHPGADDNASGVASLLEIAEWLVHQKAIGRDLGQRDFVFAAWSGEELGLLGSDAWAKAHVNPHATAGRPAAYLNFDMVGRLRNELVVQGLGSSSDWSPLLEAIPPPPTLTISPQQDSFLPTDTTSFYTQGVPVLNAFSGVHAEYHTPRDQPQLLNPEGTAQIGAYFASIAEALSRAPSAPTYQAQSAPEQGPSRSGFRVFLGTIPDYAQGDIQGVRLSGVAPAGPADQAGLRGGDIIVEVDGQAIDNLYDYTYSLEALRVGEPAQISVLRDGQRIRLEVVPSSRD